jgi:ubiquinone/menaquinone biosynthesis C-methylase UbiE
MVFYRHLDFIKPGMKIIDLACGDGTDLAYYQKLGVEAYGLDASSELIRIARAKLDDVQLTVGRFESIPFENDYFDVVLSKYSLMTSKDVRPVFKEIHRVLKPGGIMMYLVTHPFRQFVEKQNGAANCRGLPYSRKYGAR